MEKSESPPSATSPPLESATLADETLPTPSAPSHRARARAIGGAVFDSAFVALERINPPLSCASPSVATSPSSASGSLGSVSRIPGFAPAPLVERIVSAPRTLPRPVRPGSAPASNRAFAALSYAPGATCGFSAVPVSSANDAGRFRTAAGAADAPPASNRASDLETAPRERYATSRVSDDSPVGSIPGTRPSRPARRSMSTSVFSFAVGNTNASADSGTRYSTSPSETSRRAGGNLEPTSDRAPT